MKKWLFLLFCIQTCICFGQNPIGLPNVISYSRSTYSGGLQNRGVAQDENGVLFFANSEGLLSFDGTYWKLYPLPNKTIVRSVAIGTDGRIYVGGQNELGYFSAAGNGELVYTSLKSLIPGKNRSFRDVWNIVKYGNALFFRAYAAIFKYDGHSVKAYPANGQWQFLAVSGAQLLAQSAGDGLENFRNEKWNPVINQASLPPNAAIAGLLSLGTDSILMATQKNGLFIISHHKITAFNIKGGNPFLNQLVLCAEEMGGGKFAIGTHMGGCFIMDKQGRILQNFTRKEGLQNNTVLCIFTDKDHNIWLGLDDGIDYVAYNSAIKHIYPERLNEGEGYCSIVFNNRLYIGTSIQLYQVPLSGNKDLSTTVGNFMPVAGPKGSSWGLFKINNNLLFAHHEGAFHIVNGAAQVISNHTGYWNFMQFDSSKNTPLIIAGGYNGLDLMEYRDHQYKLKQSTGFMESSRYAIVENKTVWVAHPYKGIYKVAFESPDKFNSKLYTVKDGLPSDLRNRVFKIKGRMVVATERGVYEYNNRTDRFVPSANYASIFGEKDLRYLKEDPYGNIWFIEKSKPGVVDFSGGQRQLIEFPELDGELISDFENIYPLDKNNIFLGAEKGFYHINYEQYKNNRKGFKVLIRMVKTVGNTDTLLNGGYSYLPGNQSKKRSTSIPFLTDKQRSVHFEFAAPAYRQQTSVEYSFNLKGFDRDWSAWSRKTEKDYTNLPAGHFTFRVKARSNLGNVPVAAEYEFIVLPPWYQTNWAYLVYAIAFTVFNYLVYRLLKKKFRQLKQKHEVEQKQLKYLYELEIEKSEKEIIVLKNEKLQAEIDGKNSELASVAMHLLQKTEVLTRLRDELVRLKKATSEDMQSDELKKLIRILNQESKMDKEWDQFATYFDNTHSDFLKAIKEVHPTLNANELKLCAYLRMNLSTKEIAQLMNISVRGVEISRYRLRKKLQVPTETNLFKYFTEFLPVKKEMV